MRPPNFTRQSIGSANAISRLEMLSHSATEPPLALLKDAVRNAVAEYSGGGRVESLVEQGAIAVQNAYGQTTMKLGSIIKLTFEPPVVVGIAETLAGAVEHHIARLVVEHQKRTS